MLSVTVFQPPFSDIEASSLTCTGKVQFYSDFYIPANSSQQNPV